jgi:hypothetical protein
MFIDQINELHNTVFFEQLIIHPTKKLVLVKYQGSAQNSINESYHETFQSSSHLRSVSAEVPLPSNNILTSKVPSLQQSSLTSRGF